MAQSDKGWAKSNLLLICRAPKSDQKKPKSRSATLEDKIAFITVAVFAILVGIAAFSTLTANEPVDRMTFSLVKVLHFSFGLLAQIRMYLA